MSDSWYELLRPGTYRLADGRQVTYTPKDTANAEKQGKAMIRAGLRVPLCWEHDPEAEPAYLSDLHKNAWLARGYFGDVVDYKRGKDGTLYYKPNIPDESDRKQFEKVGTVSPRLDFYWTDELGHTWPGMLVSHIAVTPRPVQRNLRRGAISSAYLSHSATQRRDTHYLSQRIGEASMADSMNSQMTDADLDDTDLEGGDGGGGESAGPTEALELLKRAGLNLGPSCDSWDDFLVALRAAVHTKHGEPEEEEGDDDGLDAEAGDGAAAQPAAMPPAMMSLFTNAAKTLNDTIERDIVRCFKEGRIDKAAMQGLMKDLKSANLSHTVFKKDGSMRVLPVQIKVEFAKTLEPRVAKRASASLSHTAAVQKPDLGDGGGTKKGLPPEQKAAVDFFSDMAAKMNGESK